MADFECRQLEIGLEFVPWSFTKHNCSEGSSKPKEDAQVIRVQGGPRVSNLNYLLDNKGLMKYE